MVAAERTQKKAVECAKVLIEENFNLKNCESPLLNLHCLRQGPQSCAHAVVAISGFMSKNSDKTKEWQVFTEYLAKRGNTATVFALNWDARNPNEIWKEKGQDLVKGILGAGVGLFSSGMSKADKISKGFIAAKGLLEGVSQSKEVFLGAKKQAKLAGKLLGCALALRFPFSSQSISLVGFSLGCQVTKSCLKTLH